jgi:pyrroline-5-carboxylate reductase
MHKEKPMQTIGFIGAGNMAEALIKGILTARVFSPSDIFISDIRQERLAELSRRYGVSSASDNASLVRSAGIVVLSVKPQVLEEVLKPLRSAFAADKLVVSIVAGKRTSSIASLIGDVPIVRAMPNTPVLIGEGATVLYANPSARKYLDAATRLFAAAGFVASVEDESLIDAVTAVSGSGPAYYFLMMEEMIKAAVAVGLSPQLALNLVLQTARGAALLACEAYKTGESATELRKKVTSPRGTTEAAITVLLDGGYGRLITKAVKAARDRSIELSR